MPAAVVDYFRAFYGDPPSAILVIMIWTYAAGLGVKLLRTRGKGGMAAGLMPREAFERKVWPFWFPLVIGWALMPGMAVQRRHPALVIPSAILDDPGWLAARWIAAGGAILALALVMWCWAYMGVSWRVGIIPGDQATLVTSGPYRLIRHPIYTFSMLLVLCSMVVVPTLAMILVATPHIVIMVLKALREEQFLIKTHGRVYAEYCERTARFLPRINRR